MRRKVIGCVLVIAAVWWWRGGGEAQRRAPVRSATSELQAAVTPDGFAILARDGGRRRIIDVDRAGKVEGDRVLAMAADVRLVGIPRGAAVGWRDGTKLKFALLDDDGEPADASTWGKKVTQLCDGAASNEQRFAVGWLESDGRVWIVHGPATRKREVDAAAIEPMLAAEPTARPRWCGVAAAERNVALLFREGDSVMMNFCTAKACSGFAIALPFDARKEALVGFGCVRDSCLVATRDGQGTTRLVRTTERGKSITRPLTTAADSAVSIVGAGTRAFAIAYAGPDGATRVERVSVDGAVTELARYAKSQQAPALAWAADTLLVAEASGATHAVAMPR